MKRASPLRRTSPLRTSNPERKAKRQREYRKHLASAEYKHARKEAMWRAGGRCEYHEPVTGVTLPTSAPRCCETERLQAHHLVYPKTRPLTADDLVILCRWHHAQIERTRHGYRHQWRVSA